HIHTLFLHDALPILKSSLSTDFPDFKWKEFERELCNAGANQALAYLWKEHRDDQIKQINRKVQANHLLEFVQKTGQKSEVFFERSEEHTSELQSREK